MLSDNRVSVQTRTAIIDQCPVWIMQATDRAFLWPFL